MKKTKEEVVGQGLNTCPRGLLRLHTVSQNSGNIILYLFEKNGDVIKLNLFLSIFLIFFSKSNKIILMWLRYFTDYLWNFYFFVAEGNFNTKNLCSLGHVHFGIWSFVEGIFVFLNRGLRYFFSNWAGIAAAMQCDTAHWFRWSNKR